MSAVQNVIHLIILTETWIRNESDAKSFSLPNYKHVYNYRLDNRGGGVSIFIHNSLQYDILEDICDDDVHYLWIYLRIYSINIGAIYNPGRKHLYTFLDKYTMQLENKKRSIVFGDFNIDLLSETSETLYYKEILQTAGY